MQRMGRNLNHVQMLPPTPHCCQDCFVFVKENASLRHIHPSLLGECVDSPVQRGLWAEVR